MRPVLAAAAPSLLVPAYAHPAVDAGLWRRLADLAPVLRAVVINPANGPGERVDRAYPPVLDLLRAAGVRLVGYVDTAYGRRPPGQLAADLVGYRDRYGITDVFFDQVAMGLPELDHYADVVRRARWGGARFVVLNPGTRPHPGYLDLADVVVTFEGPWSVYRAAFQHATPRPDPVRGTGRLCHLVHGMPVAAGVGEAYDELLRLASAAGVTTLFGSDGSGANPWDRLPEALVNDLLARRSTGV